MRTLGKAFDQGFPRRKFKSRTNERYIRPSATRFVIAIAFDDGGRHEGSISCKRTPTLDVPAIYEP
jgi:hypothetical protein